MNVPCVKSDAGLPKCLLTRFVNLVNLAGNCSKKTSSVPVTVISLGTVNIGNQLVEHIVGSCQIVHTLHLNK